jgi:molybdate transport system ATP-binding protein
MLDLDIQLRRGANAMAFQLSITEPVSGIFGASGSGKTTLLHCVSGLLRPDSGRMVLNGEVLFDAAKKWFVPPHRRHIGLVFQDAQLFPHLSVRNNLLYGYRRLTPKQRRFELGPVVDLLEIGELLERRPGQLSGGQKQRVALGRALLYSPQLLLMDEPLAALDERLKRQILPFLRRIRDVAQIPMLYVSHSLDEILYLTQTLTLVDQGRILGHGACLDVLSKEEAHEVADHMEIRNLWSVEILENHREQSYSVARLGKERLILPPAPANVGQTVTLGVRAAQIALSRQRISGITIQNQLPGQIMRIITRRHGALVEIDAGVIVVAEVNAKTVEDLNLKVSDTVYCLIKAQSLEYPDS